MKLFFIILAMIKKESTKTTKLKIKINIKQNLILNTTNKSNKMFFDFFRLA
jgi:hypothetical protein